MGNSASASSRPPPEVPIKKEGTIAVDDEQFPTKVHGRHLADGLEEVPSRHGAVEGENYLDEYREGGHPTTDEQMEEDFDAEDDVVHFLLTSGDEVPITDHGETSLGGRSSIRGSPGSRPNLGLLPEDMYSLLAFPNSRLSPVLVLLTTAIQFIALALLSLDGVDFDRNHDDFGPSNSLRIPPNVRWQVAAAQVFVIGLTLLSESNVLWALNLYNNGYDRSLILRIMARQSEKAAQLHQSAEINIRASLRHSLKKTALSTAEFVKKAKHDKCLFGCLDGLSVRWHGANCLRFLAGAVSHAALFLLVIRSEAVLTIILNSAAVEIIARLNQAVFKLARWGSFGQSVKNAAKSALIDQAHFALRVKVKGRALSKWKFIGHAATRTFLFGLGVGFWLWCYVRQQRGLFVSPVIRLQLGDGSNLGLETYSGIYQRVGGRWTETSRGYVRYDAVRGNTRIEFCHAIDAWVLRDLRELQPSRPCGWKVRSYTTEDYEVLESTKPGFEWWIDEIQGIPIQLDHFSLTLVPEQYEATSGSPSLCPVGVYGYGCEFDMVCPLLTVEGDPFPGIADVEFPLLPNVQIQGRPVYVSFTGSEYNVVLYNGRRWVLVSSTDAWQLVRTGQPPASLEELVEFLNQQQDLASWAPPISFASEPLDVGTVRGMAQASPQDLLWFAPQSSLDGGVVLLPDEVPAFPNTVLRCGTGSMVDLDSFENALPP